VKAGTSNYPHHSSAREKAELFHFENDWSPRGDRANAVPFFTWAFTSLGLLLGRCVAHRGTKATFERFQMQLGQGVFMFLSSRELIVLFAAGALAACLMGFGVLLAVDSLVRAAEPVSVRMVLGDH
jgi:hypothetical protein